MWPGDVRSPSHSGSETVACEAGGATVGQHERGSLRGWCGGTENVQYLAVWLCVRNTELWVSVTTTTRTDARASAKKEAATAATTRFLLASLLASSGGTSGSGGGSGCGSGERLRTLGPRLSGRSSVCRRERRARSHSAADEWCRRRRCGGPGVTRHDAERSVRTGTIKSSLAARGTRIECTDRKE